MSAFRFQLSDFRIQISDFRFQISYFRFQISDFRFQISDFRSRHEASATRFQISEYRFQISDFRCQMPPWQSSNRADDITTDFCRLSAPQDYRLQNAKGLPHSITRGQITDCRFQRRWHLQGAGSGRLRLQIADGKGAHVWFQREADCRLQMPTLVTATQERALQIADCRSLASTESQVLERSGSRIQIAHFRLQKQSRWVKGGYGGL